MVGDRPPPHLSVTKGSQFLPPRSSKPAGQGQRDSPLTQRSPLSLPSTAYKPANCHLLPTSQKHHTLEECCPLATGSVAAYHVGNRTKGPLLYSPSHLPSNVRESRQDRGLGSCDADFPSSLLQNTQLQYQPFHLESAVLPTCLIFTCIISRSLQSHQFTQALQTQTKLARKTGCFIFLCIFNFLLSKQSEYVPLNASLRDIGRHENFGKFTNGLKLVTELERGKSIL